VLLRPASRKEVVAPQNAFTPAVAAVPLTEYKVSTQQLLPVHVSPEQAVYAVVAPPAAPITVAETV
jgi:hypothetical protein